MAERDSVRINNPDTPTYWYTPRHQGKDLGGIKKGTTPDAVEIFCNIIGRYRQFWKGDLRWPSRQSGIYDQITAYGKWRFERYVKIERYHHEYVIQGREKATIVEIDDAKIHKYKNL